MLASEHRLELLRSVITEPGSTVSALAASTKLQESYASIELRKLNARGLIQARARGRYVFYWDEANPSVEHAGGILDALRAAFSAKTTNERIIQTATAFTHPRRIMVVKALGLGGKTIPELSMATQISQPALYRHLNKLAARGFVKVHDERWRLDDPRLPLAHTLLGIAKGS